MPGSGLSSIRADKPDVIKRLEFVISALHQFIADNDDTGSMSRFSFVAKAMIEEVSEELAERDEESMRYYMAQIGQIIAWIGHGDTEKLPKDLRAFIEPRAEIEQTAS